MDTRGEWKRGTGSGSASTKEDMEIEGSTFQLLSSLELFQILPVLILALALSLSLVS